MKKLFFSSFMMFLFFGQLFAQTDPARDELDHIFQYIDKSQIPSGYLDEYGPQVVDKNWLNGVLTDSNRIYDIGLFRYLYNDIENSKLYSAAAAMTLLETLNTAISQLNTSSTTPLIFLTGQYSILREDAIQQNLFTSSNNQVFDVAGRSQSPYQLQNVFAASPVKQKAPQTNTLSLNYNPALSYSNNNKSISQVWVDFLDGQAYRSIAANGTVSKTYSDSSGYKRFAIKVQYTDGSTNYCYSGQYVTVVNSAARYVPLPQFDIDNPTKIIDAVPGQHSAGKVYVRYSTKRNGTALQGKMVKPFIIVEGYDIHDIAPKLQETNYDVNKLINEWDRLARNTSYDFNKELDETAGYDLVFVDYYTMDYIQNNSKMLQKVIEWVNGQKVIAGSTEQNVVMGISLGGLLARYTLARMTKELGTASTKTRLLLTHDSPHQGGNVPLGFQHFLYDFGEAKIIRPLKNLSVELGEFYKLSEQPATQQLLIARVTDANGGVAFNNFLAGEYRTMITFDPQQPQPSYQFKATAQGSQCSRYVMEPGTVLAYKDGNVATANFALFSFRSKYKLSIQINALPQQGTSAQISYVKMQRNIRLFFGAIGTGWKTTYEKTRYSPANIIPWDAVPGGTQSASGRSGGSFSNYSTTPEPFASGQTFFGSVWRSAVFPLFNVKSYLDIPFQQDVLPMFR